MIEDESHDIRDGDCYPGPISGGRTGTGKAAVLSPSHEPSSVPAAACRHPSRTSFNAGSITRTVYREGLVVMRYEKKKRQPAGQSTPIAFGVRVMYSGRSIKTAQPKGCQKSRRVELFRGLPCAAASPFAYFARSRWIEIDLEAAPGLLTTH